MKSNLNRSLNRASVTGVSLKAFTGQATHAADVRRPFDTAVSYMLRTGDALSLLFCFHAAGQQGQALAAAGCLFRYVQEC